MQNKNHERTVVAIGYSAGGHEPLLNFFDHTPGDEVSYVVLRHLPKDHQSTLSNILERHSPLQVIEAVSGMMIEKNKIYLMPAAYYLSVTGSAFKCIQRPLYDPKGNRAIDVFLCSLAAQRLLGKIAVILSGGGTDGAQGAAKVKEAGGIIIVQHPDTCDHNSMPIAAMRATVADHLARPEDIPSLIQKYMKKMETRVHQRP